MTDRLIDCESRACRRLQNPPRFTSSRLERLAYAHVAGRGAPFSITRGMSFAIPSPSHTPLRYVSMCAILGASTDYTPTLATPRSPLRPWNLAFVVAGSAAGFDEASRMAPDAVGSTNWAGWPCWTALSSPSRPARSEGDQKYLFVMYLTLLQSPCRRNPGVIICCAFSVGFCTPVCFVRGGKGRLCVDVCVCFVFVAYRTCTKASAGLLLAFAKGYHRLLCMFAKLKLLGGQSMMHTICPQRWYRRAPLRS